ncbi:MAG: hypothetical protein KDC98_17725 [Planctomycetes bacterium]|nr:hypothetical protein [Planctomycetota bacterium]
MGIGAQTTTKVLPAGMDLVEGPSVYTYPFGRPDGAIQLLYDATRVTQGVGLVTGLRFRQSQVTAAQTHPGYTKDYKVTAYTVTTSAAGMVADLATNVGSAVGHVAFQGTLTLPPIQPLAVQPAPFNITIPFTSPFAFDGSQGNLLLVVETDDLNAVQSGYRIDAVNFSASQVTGLTTSIDVQGCAVGANSLALTCSETSVVVGGSLTQTVTSSVTGAFPVIFAAVGLGGQAVDLTPYGMVGCTQWPSSPLVQLTLENTTGGYPPIAWSLPNAPSIEGVGLVSQAFGVAASGALSASVTSNGVGSRIGGAAGPTVDMGMAFRSSSGSWFMGTNGVFVAVAELEGIFP